MAESWHTLSREDRAEALELAAAQTGRAPHLLEKDVWVVWVLSAIHRPTTLTEVEAKQEGGWLGAIDRRKPEEIMTGLPPAATDPFLSLRRRLENTLALYRFDPAGGKLIDWAIAQSGVEDPMTRFNRNQLEQFWQRWKFELDAHLTRLLGEARRDPASLSGAMQKAPPAAQRAVQKLQGMVK